MLISPSQILNSKENLQFLQESYDELVKAGFDPEPKPGVVYPTDYSLLVFLGRLVKFVNKLPQNKDSNLKLEVIPDGPYIYIVNENLYTSQKTMDNFVLRLTGYPRDLGDIQLGNYAPELKAKSLKYLLKGLRAYFDTSSRK